MTEEWAQDTAAAQRKGEANQSTMRSWLGAQRDGVPGASTALID